MSIDIDARSSGPPLDHDEAVRLDEQIQAMADKAGEHLDYLADLLAEAKAGQIHQALQFQSWTEYVAERLKPITKALDADDRRALVVELHGAGMSIRAIAEATEQSKSTVQRQVSQSGTAEHVDGTTGLDGKTYPRLVSDQDTELGDESGIVDTQQDSEQRKNGGARGKWEPSDYASRAKSFIENINGDAELRTRIYELIDKLLASIKLAAED